MIPLPARALAAIALVAAVALMGWRVTAWREGYLQTRAAQDALRRTEKALATRTAELRLCTDREAVAQQALRAAAVAAESRAAEDRAIAERIEHDLQTRLAAADARGRDLARRLRDATACPGAGAVPGATGAAGGPAGAGAQSGDGGAVERATEDHFVACALDAAVLTAWQEWWRAVSAERL